MCGGIIIIIIGSIAVVVVVVGSITRRRRNDCCTPSNQGIVIIVRQRRLHRRHAVVSASIIHAASATIDIVPCRDFFNLPLSTITIDIIHSSCNNIHTTTASLILVPLNTRSLGQGGSRARRSWGGPGATRAKAIERDFIWHFLQTVTFFERGKDSLLFAYDTTDVITIDAA